MSDTKTRMPLPRAQQLVEAVRAELAPGCIRIEAAGSTRRRDPTIGDLELVAIPKLHEDLLGSPSGSELDFILAQLVASDRLVNHKDGERFKQYTLRKAGVKLDLFICDAATWAVCFMIRTGPASFSQRFVTQQPRGLLPKNMRIGDGSSAGTNRLYVDDRPVELAEERDLFKAAGVAWLEPWERR